MTTSPVDIVDQQILLNLGRVSANFNALEFEMGLFISDLVNIKDRQVGFMIACELRYTAKIAIVMALYEYKVADLERVEKLREHLKLISALEDERNKYMHSSVHIFANGKTKSMKPSTKLKKGFDFTPTEIKPEELELFSEKALSYKHLLKLMRIDYFKNLCVRS